jgi:hypothetical protein
MLRTWPDDAQRALIYFLLVELGLLFYTRAIELDFELMQSHGTKANAAYIPDVVGWIGKRGGAMLGGVPKCL